MTKLRDRGRRFTRVLLGSLILGLVTFSVYAWSASPIRTLGNPKPEELRIRTSRVRMKLVDPTAVADRFADYAAMSSFAYIPDEKCEPSYVLSSSERLEKAFLKNRGWIALTRSDDWPPEPILEPKNRCDSDSGLYYDVWKRGEAPTAHAVIVFRGTGGQRAILSDWSANLGGAVRWAAHQVKIEIPSQYSEADEHIHLLVKELKANHGVGHISTAGHSLGGGLAQSALYERPDDIEQAYAFNPSPVNHYTMKCKENRKRSCEAPGQQEEARIYRIYARHEILANVRLIQKTLLRLSRHIHEIRLDESRGHAVKQHSIEQLAAVLMDWATKDTPLESASRPWYRGEDGLESILREEQLSAYSIRDSVCPD